MRAQRAFNLPWNKGVLILGPRIRRKGMTMRRSWTILAAVSILAFLASYGAPGPKAHDSSAQAPSTCCGVGDTAGLVSYWKLDETVETTVADTFSGFTGTLTYASPAVAVPTFTAGKVSNAMSLSNGQYVTVPSNAALNITGDLTIALWVRPDSIACSGLDAAYVLVSKRSANSPTPYEFMIGCGGSLRYEAWPGHQPYAYAGTDPGLVTAGVWQHVAMTRSYSGTIATVTFYVNGVPVGSSSQDIGPTVASSDPVWISRDGYHTGYTTQGSFSGMMDEIAIFNRALTPSEMANIYESTNAGGPYCQCETLPAVTVTSPNGGETWIAGSSHDITWSSTGIIDNVEIEYSSNNGTDWTSVTASTANTGSYSWTVPYAASTQCLIRVSDVSNAEVLDISNAAFNIFSDITEPNDDSATAAVLPMGTTEDLIYDGGARRDIDWYKFFVPAEAAGQDLKVNVRVTSPYPDPLPANWRSDIDFELLNGALGVRGITMSGSDNETQYLPNVASGWYYIYIGYCTTDYADSSTYARYSVTLEAGTEFGLGYLSGRVVDGVGQGIEKVFLTLYHNPGDWNTGFPAMTSGPGGNFTVAFLPGTYDLNFAGKAGGRSDGCVNQAPINVVAEYYNNKKAVSLADHISLVAGQTQNLGDVALGVGALVSGHVTDGGGNPLANVFVGSYDAQGYSADNMALTNAAGDYSLNGVPIGGAKIRFWNSVYAHEYYNDKPSFGSGDLLATQSGVTIPDINAQLTTGGSISGNVNDGQGTGLQVNVRLYSVLDDTFSRSSVLSSASGDFGFSRLMPGDYKIFFSAAGTAYASEWYNDAASFAQAAVITVTEGNATTGISAELNAPVISVCCGVGDTAGLVSYWKLDETVETTVADTFSGFTGTLTYASPAITVPAFTAGKVTNALSLSNGQYVTVPSNAALNITGDLTIALWVRPDSIACSGPDAAYVLVSKRSANSPTPYEFMIGCGGSLRYEAWPGQQPYAYAGTDPGLVTAGVWQHVAMTRSYSGTIATVTFYINGVPVGSSSQDIGPTVASSDPVWISRDGYHTGYTTQGSFSGMMDEIAIFNRALTPSEMMNIYGLSDAGGPYCQCEPTPAITVISPNGGETWTAGSSHDITWSSTGTIDSVNIDYSTDNGSHWIPMMAANTTNDGSHAWTVPYAASTQCLIRVSDASNAEVLDISNAVFSIFSDITEPNNDSATAAELPMGMTDNLIYDGGGATQDIDWYKFFVPAEAAGQDLKVNVRVTSPYPDPLPPNWRGDIDFELLDGALVERGIVFGGSDNETLYLPNVASGWYYIFIGYCTTSYPDYPDHARYSITLETGTNFGLGYLSGRVVDGAGQGIEKVFVTLYHYPGNWNISFPSMTAGPGGNFTVAFLPGTYDLNFTGKPDGREEISRNQAPINVVAEYYNDKKAGSLADHVGVTAGQTVDLGDVALDIGAIVLGHVTDGGGNPLANVSVSSSDAQGYSAGNSALTNAAGDYSLNGVPIGGAKVRFGRSAYSLEYYAAEYYNDKPSLGSGDLLATESGVTIPDISAQLTTGGSISGNVSNGQGTGLQVNVRLYSVLDATFARATQSSSAATGGFNFSNVMPGDYKIFFNAGGTAYASEWHADANSFAQATIIPVTEGNATTGIDAQLARPEINLKQGATDIATGGTYGFGSSIVGADSDRVFTLENLGTDTLTLTGLPLTVTGTNADQFAITVQPASPVAAAGSTAFTVRFHPTSAGDMTARISIASNDGNENPYVLNLTGTGIIPATITVTSPNGGESWVAGSTHAVTWTQTGLIGTVTIDLYKGGVYQKTHWDGRRRRRDILMGDRGRGDRRGGLSSSPVAGSNLGRI